MQQLRREIMRVSRAYLVEGTTASIAHELNQPLSAILTNAEAAQMLMARETPDLREVQSILADIRADNLRAHAIIQGILALLKDQPLQRQPLNLNEVIGDMLKLIRAEATLRKVNIRVELTPDLPFVQGDRVHLTQVLINLALNGMDAMEGLPPGAKTLAIRTERPDAARVKVTVSDRGPGIPEALLTRIFEAFYTTKPDGIGMGLCIAHTIIEAHEGEIRAENGSGGGAVLSFSLPVMQEAPA